MDKAWLAAATGTLSPQDAGRQAIRELCAQGIPAVSYPSGHVDTLETAVRRALVTGVNQSALRVQIDLADQLGCDLVETTAHAGARPSHVPWQGKVFSLRGKTPGYPLLTVATGYGSGDGLGGWNCRHSIHPFLDGSTPAYTQEQLDAYNEKKYTYNGKTLTEYEAMQQQRYLERNIRRWKREYTALDAAGLDNTEAAVKLKAWREKEKDFLQQTGRQRESSRSQVGTFGRSEAGKATWAAKRTAQALEKTAPSSIITTVVFDDKQFGKKVGKHAKDYGLSASTPTDRAKMKQIISNCVENADERVIGNWRGYDAPVIFHIKNSDVVITKENGAFISILKGGVENARVKDARGQ
jgi:hypothetical protein